MLDDLFTATTPLDLQLHSKKTKILSTLKRNNFRQQQLHGKSRR